MATDKLRTVVRAMGQNLALRSGAVSPTPYTLEFEEVPVLISAFRAMVRELRYDVCEMAVTTYLCAREHGVPFTAIPVFPARGFHHGAVLTRRGSGISTPADLAGKRVGVSRGWTVTTGVWVRGIMADEHGLDLERVSWVLSGDEHVESYRPPANVEPIAAGADLAAMLQAGEIDAAIGIDGADPDVVPVISDPDRAAARALTERGTYPINHLVVVRDELLELLPDLAATLVAAFTASKDEYVSALRAGLSAPNAADRMLGEVLEQTGSDPLPFGLEPNQLMLERLIGYAVDQKILTAPVTLEDVFAT